MESFSGRSHRSVPSRETQPVERDAEPRRRVEADEPVAAPAREVRRELKVAPRGVSWKWLAAGALVLLLLAAMMYVVPRFFATPVPGVKSDRFQAIWLTDKSLYFGKLESVNDEYYRMTEVFYTQVAKSTDGKQATDSPNVQLVKLGNELPYAEDMIMIPKKQVLFYENLKTDSKVTQAIEEYQKKNK